jgi:hypothetical protein
VPENLKSFLQALDRAYLSSSSHPHASGRIVSSCANALIFVARHEPGLFPKPFARAIILQMDCRRLLNLAQHIGGLDLRGIRMEPLEGRWQRLDADSHAFVERLIEPSTFSQILDSVFTDKEVDVRKTMDTLLKFNWSWDWIPVIIVDMRQSLDGE